MRTIATRSREEGQRSRRQLHMPGKQPQHGHREVRMADIGMEGERAATEREAEAHGRAEGAKVNLIDCVEPALDFAQHAERDPRRTDREQRIEVVVGQREPGQPPHARERSDDGNDVVPGCI